MLEVEMKFPVASFAGVEDKLTAWGAHGEAPLRQADHHLNAPDRDFARTDETLRLRRVGDANFLTYKGPKRPGPGKIRTEVEVPVGGGDTNADAFLRLLGHLGYRPVIVVRKTRRPFHLRRQGFAVEVCLDDVEGLGKFVEVEIIAPEEQLDAARQALTALAAELGLEKDERRSYLELQLAAQGVKRGSP
jgi:adenylate cyclase, class 2